MTVVLPALTLACGAITGIDALTKVDALDAGGSSHLDGDVGPDGQADAGPRFCQLAPQNTALLCDDFDDATESPSTHWVVSAGAGTVAIEPSPSAATPPNQLLVTIPAAIASTPAPALLSNQFPQPATALSLAFDVDVSIPAANGYVELASAGAPPAIVYINTDSTGTIYLFDIFTSESIPAGSIAGKVHPRITLEIVATPSPAANVSVNGKSTLKRALATTFDTGQWTARIGLKDFAAMTGAPPPFEAATARFDNVVVTSR